MTTTLHAAEFFAGIGLARLALEAEGIAVVWANDISPAKQRVYVRNFPAHNFHLGDVRAVRGADLPPVDLATASFPCTDVSLAGARAGLAGAQSGMVWEFLRVVAEMPRRPPVVLLENVLGLATSRGDADLAATIGALNELGYWCDALTVDARHFAPQSRPRLFVVGSQTPFAGPSAQEPSDARPAWIAAFAERRPALRLHAPPLPPLPNATHTLAEVVERLPEDDPAWWDTTRTARLVESLSPRNAARLAALRESPELVWRTAFRRTRAGVPRWEIRADAIAGCLRTARGGSSNQAVVEAGDGVVRARWLTAREYARLQGAPSLILDGVSANAARFGLGDGVCVPAVRWVLRHAVIPTIHRSAARAR